jgi:hypothetical protein
MDVPDYLRDKPRWLLWKWATPDNRPRFKMPVQPNGKPAMSTDPGTWCSYDEAVAAINKFEGLGIGLGFGVWGIDLDGAFGPDGLKDWAAEIIARVDSYTEFSPSGKGVHILVIGDKSMDSGLKVNISETEHFEAYMTARYFTFTGNHVPGTPDDLQDRTTVFKALRAEYEALRPSSQRVRLARRASQGSETGKAAGKALEQAVHLTDEELLAKAQSGPSGEAFKRLWEGDLADYKGDHSTADMALCGRLAFWTGKDPEQIDRLFRQSELMRPKWDTRRGLGTYGEQTIEIAIDNCEETYSGPDTSSLNFVEQLKAKRAAKAKSTQVVGDTVKTGHVKDHERGLDKTAHGKPVHVVETARAGQRQIEANEGTARFEAHGGEGRLRKDGSAFSADTDTEAFAAEEWVAHYFGQEPDRSIGHNDAGYDFMIGDLKVDAKLHPPTGHLIVNPGKVKADRYVVVIGSRGAFKIKGWATAQDVLDHPQINFGYGLKHAVPYADLRTEPMIEEGEAASVHKPGTLKPGVRLSPLGQEFTAKSDGIESMADLFSGHDPNAPHVSGVVIMPEPDIKPAHLTTDDTTTVLPAEVDSSLNGGNQPSPVALTHRADGVIEKPIKWMWKYRIPLGMTGMIDGDPGVGKSSIVSALTAHITTGTPWPDGCPCPIGDVIIIGGEDVEESVMIPRLRAAGANISRVHLMHTVIDEITETTRLFRLPDDTQRLVDEVIRVGAIMVVFDPIMPYISGRKNTNSDQDVRQALTQLANDAGKLGCTVTLLRHLNKQANDTQVAMYRGLGSIGFSGLSRWGFTVARVKKTKNPTVFSMAPNKASVSAQAKAYRYTIQPVVYPLEGYDEPMETSKIEWQEEVDEDADDLLAPVEGKASPKLDLAVELLYKLLEGSPMRSEDAIERLKAQGIQRTTSFEATKQMGVVIRKVGYGAGAYWAWGLPGADFGGLMAAFGRDAVTIVGDSVTTKIRSKSVEDSVSESSEGSGQNDEDSVSESSRGFERIFDESEGFLVFKSSKDSLKSGGSDE